MVKITKEVGYPEGGKKYKVPADSVWQDPRADIVTNDFTPGQKIDKGTKGTVQGTWAMLKSKSKKATCF